MKFLLLFEDNQFVRYDELPEETKWDIAYWVAECAGILRPDQNWGGSGLPGGEDVYNVLNDSWPPLQLKLSVLDPHTITGYSRSVSKVAVERYVQMLDNGSIPPPILVDGTKFIDGGHRMKAALIRKVPIPTVDIGPILRMNWAAFLANEPDPSIPEQ